MAETDIAVVGMACRLPGAPSVQEFWRMLREGRDALVELSDEHLLAAGVPPDMVADPEYVKKAMLLADIDKFDAGFFGMSPRDAAVFDPQHRVWLEVCWEAFENAGHVPDRFDGRVGVFAGCGMDTYLLHNILSNPDLVQRIGMFLIRHTGNDKDFLATRTSYQFDLRGPSVNVLTACSTSLVAIHQAAQSLLAGECEMALAGGVTILVPQDRGYQWKEGEVLSPDGNCRAFDKDSRGTIFGSGAGVVLLRRLADAIADGDHIHAIIAGSAVNNDGARKVSFLAPSVDGYAEVVAEALALADIPADQVQYVEAHGTGTSVGDPIEIEALTQAFRVTTDRTGYCAIGSCKPNIGHLDTAAGIAGFMKAVLAMQHGEIPQSLHYRSPNPLIDFDKSPFYVAGEALEWPRLPHVERIAGISSLGVGGTNAHVILREAVEQAQAAAVPYPRRCHLIPVSGKVDEAVLGNARQLAKHLRAVAAADLPDVAWTAQHGRRAFARRAFAVGAGGDAVATALQAADFKAGIRSAPDRAPSVVFLFAGGGAQYPGMARELYEHEPLFREHADACLAAMTAELAGEVEALLFGELATPEHGERMERPGLILPTLFLVEYSLARTLMAFGVEPDAMIGHSLGEYVAGTIGGTFTLAQVLQALALRGELLEEATGGAVLTVSMAPEQAQSLTHGELSLAAANAPQLSAVAGSVAAIERAEVELQQRGIEYQRLRIGVAAHSHMLDPLLDRFRAGLEGMALSRPQRPWISNVTGDWADPDRVVDPEYWVEHLRRTVRFQDGIATLLAGGDRVFVEVGPGKALSSLVRMHERAKGSPCLVTVPHAKDTRAADEFLLDAVGRLWQLGVPIDWQAFHGGTARRRVPLPTYAFQRQRHWIEPGAPVVHEGVLRGEADLAPPTRLPEADWVRLLAFRGKVLPESARIEAKANWLCVGSGDGLREFVAAVSASGGRAAIVEPAASESRTGATWRLPVADTEAWGRALTAAIDEVGAVQRVLFALPLEHGDAVYLVGALLAMWQALGRADLTTGLRVLAVTSGAARVGREAMRAPGQAAAAAFLRVAAVEYEGVTIRCVDLEEPVLDAVAVELLRREVETAESAMQVAWRGGARHVQEIVAGEAEEEPSSPPPSPWRQNGVYLVTGGLGGIGLVLADHLATQVRARLALVSRRGLPPRELWDRWLELRRGDRTARLIQQIRALEQRGAEVEVLAADVADKAAMRRVLQAVDARFGGLHGIVHAAGVLDDGLIQMRTAERCERMLAGKIGGALVLDELTADRALDLFVVFGSTSGLAAIPGQCDYAAANAALDAFAGWRAQLRPGRSLSVDWGVWQDVGMLAATSDASCAPAPRWLGERRERAPEIEFVREWTPVTDWQLAEHRIRGGDCVMPGTGHLELMVTALRAVAGCVAVTLDNVEFLSPLAFSKGNARDVQVVVRKAPHGFTVRVQSAAPGDADLYSRTTHARARAKAGGGYDGLVDLAAWRRDAQQPAAIAVEQAALVDFGPRWQCIEAVALGDGVVLGELSLPPEFTADLDDHALHPAVLDMAFGCGIRLLSQQVPDALFVPAGCDEVVVSGRLPRRVMSRVVLRSFDTNTRLATLDVSVCSPDGIAIVELRGLSLIGVRGEFGAGDKPVVGSGGTRQRRAPAEVIDRPAPRIAAILPRGITGPEGMQGLERALATESTQVVVSSMDVQRVARWLMLPPEKPKAASTGADDHAAATAGDGPRDEVEVKLCASYHDLLGVEDTGLDQDFFELGGHSLLAVRLFARIHKDFGLDLELANLLTAGTVRKLAVVVRAELGLPEPGTEPVRSVAAKKGQHVVPIQVEGTRPKLFLVHGAGGNVLGFRDLSHYFGVDQPVYGLQARGVDGKQQPHDSIDEMARSYLAELREVQPHGPYFLGGYSGGGLVAYEMAQQLLAVGERIGFLGMIDTWCPQMRQRSKLERAVIHLGRLLRRGPMYPFRILRMKFDRRASARRTEQARDHGGVMPQALRGEDVQFAFERAFNRHRVQPYPGRAWIFRSTESIGMTRYVFDDELGWKPFITGGIVAVKCPGDHFTMCTEPNVQFLCREYMAAMDQAIAALAASDNG
ncbi:MAG: SDR family NAD(P)-dependent oxidoreductase [Planctomycetes bacterium]|nr:SDR family NAD(P)-dependent oxidoreductase [Planctomycetota bacterium]